MPCGSCAALSRLWSRINGASAAGSQVRPRPLLTASKMQMGITGGLSARGRRHAARPQGDEVIPYPTLPYPKADPLQNRRVTSG